MKTLHPIHAGNTGRIRELKRAILAAFHRPKAEALQRLAGFKEDEWEKVLWWLDISGMALYFFDQICCRGAPAELPESLQAKLKQRLRNNRIRTQYMFEEAALLAGWLNGAGIPYALLKGVTLVPHAVPDAALRWQADLDFLVGDKNFALAAHYVHRLGYRIYARSGRTLEFRTGVPRLPDISRMYCNHWERALELHLCRIDGEDAERLHRRELREMQNTSFFALSTADILVQQGLHLLKHLSGEHTRVSWVLEFWRNVHAHRFDAVFWLDVQRIAAAEQNGDLAMGVAFWLADALWGSAEIGTPPQWCAENLPKRVRLWLGLYALDVLLADNVGSKLYALLKQEIPGPVRDARSVRQVLIPARIPLRLASAAPGEHPLVLAKRYFLHFNYIAQRVKFHLFEGVRFALQFGRWKKALARCEQ